MAVHSGEPYRIFHLGVRGWGKRNTKTMIIMYIHMSMYMYVYLNFFVGEKHANMHQKLISVI